MWTPVHMESALKYHPWIAGALTCTHKLGGGHCLVGSLTGAVASQRVTEALKGWLRRNGNPPMSVKAQASLTARPTSRAGTKVGLSDPTGQRGMPVAYRIKATPGITG